MSGNGHDFPETLNRGKLADVPGSGFGVRVSNRQQMTDTVVPGGSQDGQTVVNKQRQLWIKILIL